MKLELDETPDYITGQTREDCERDAKVEGLIAFFANDDELFLDLDHGSEINQQVFNSMRYNGIATVGPSFTTVSKSGHGTHVYIRLAKPLCHEARVALQAALGSDPLREMLSIATRDFSCLYETAEWVPNVLKFRGQK